MRSLYIMLSHRRHAKEVTWQHRKENRQTGTKDKKGDRRPAEPRAADIHKGTLKQYKSPAKRHGGKSQSSEQVAHKVARSAVKKAGYRKEGDRWEKS